MNAAVKGCLLLAIAAAPAFGQTPSNAMNCPMMSDQMQKQMGSMMTDMRAMMEDTKDPAAKSRMQTMQERMRAMANMQKMHGGMMGTAPDNPSDTAEAPTPSPDQRKENHEEHHPGP